MSAVFVTLITTICFGHTSISLSIFYCQTFTQQQLLLKLNEFFVTEYFGLLTFFPLLLGIPRFQCLLATLFSDSLSGEGFTLSCGNGGDGTGLCGGDWGTRALDGSGGTHHWLVDGPWLGCFGAKNSTGTIFYNSLLWSIEGNLPEVCMVEINMASDAGLGGTVHTTDGTLE